MRKQDVIKHFGSQKAVAEALGVSEAAISAWDDEIPRGRAFELQVITGGKLRVNGKQQEKRAI